MNTEVQDCAQQSIERVLKCPRMDPDLAKRLTDHVYVMGLCSFLSGVRRSADDIQ